MTFSAMRLGAGLMCAVASCGVAESDDGGDSTGATAEPATSAANDAPGTTDRPDATNGGEDDTTTGGDTTGDSVDTDPASGSGSSSGGPVCDDCPGTCDERGLCTGGPEGGPIFLSVTADAPYLPVETYGVDYEQAQVGITIIATDPDGIGDLVGGTYRLRDSDLTLGPLASAAEEGAYFAQIHWDDIEPTNLQTEPGGGEVVVRISMFDQDGHESIHDLPILVACGTPGSDPWPTWGVCGSCTDLATTPESCGACDYGCAQAHPAPAGIDAADVAVGGWCEDFACKAVVGRRGEGLDFDASPNCDALCAEHGLSCLDTGPLGDWGSFFDIYPSTVSYFPGADSPLGPDLGSVIRTESPTCGGSPACFLYDCDPFIDGLGFACDTPFATLSCPSLFGETDTPVDTVLCSCG